MAMLVLQKKTGVTNLIPDIDTFTYSGNSFDVTAQEDGPSGLAFNDDGSKFYVSGYLNDAFRQYSMPNNYSVVGMSYDSVSTNITQDANANGMFAKPDGTKFYIVGYTNDEVYQYSLSVAWDASTITYDSVSFSISSQTTTPSGLHFKPDGTKMYIGADNAGLILQYTLSTPWDMTTASYDSVSFNMNAQSDRPSGLWFDQLGYKMFVISGGAPATVQNTIFQYSLSTAWDISTASYDSKSLDVTTQENNALSLIFTPDGKTLIVSGTQNNTLYMYTAP